MKNFIEIIAQFDNETGIIDEIMIHIDNTGKIIRAYCWTDGVPKIEKYNEKKGEYYVSSCSIKQGKNPLFVDLSLNWITKNLHMMYISIQNDSEITEDTNLAKAILKYKNLSVDLD